MLETPPQTEPVPSSRPDGLRSRARRALRAEVAAVALDLFFEQGFDNTTVEQIAAAVGMSRSSFFRYFPTKEDVILGDLVAYGQQLLDALTRRPDTEPVWTALRMALQPVVPADDHPGARRTSRLFMKTPTLKARHYEKTMTWQAVLIPEVTRRLGIAEPQLPDPRPAALISCALACLDAAIATWTASDDSPPLTELLDTAMNSVSPCTLAEPHTEKAPSPRPA